MPAKSHSIPPKVRVALTSDKTPLPAGTIISDFRGDKWRYEYATRVGVPGKSGKVFVSAVEDRALTREFYATVFELEVVWMNLDDARRAT